MANVAENTTPTLDLDAAQTSELASIRSHYVAVEHDEAALADGQKAYDKKRALAFREQWKFVTDLGKATVERYVEHTLGYNVTPVRSNGFAICALAIVGVDVYAETDAVKRKPLHNRTIPVRQALDALTHFRADHEALTEEKFVEWYLKQGKLRGLHQKFTKPNAGEDATDHAKDDEAVTGILENHAGIEVAPIPGLEAGARTIYVAQGQGDATRLVRLDVSPADIAKLASKAPDPMTNASPSLLFYRQLSLLVEATVPDGMSDIPVTPLKPGEKISASTPMLPAYAIYLHRDGVFSVAAARKHDGLVVTAEPQDGVLTYMPDGETYIDTVTRKNTFAALRESHSAAGYQVGTMGGDVVFEKEGAKKHRLSPKPLTEMGSVFTHRVAGFKAAASATLFPAESLTFQTEFFGPLVKVKGKVHKPITVAVVEKGISFKQGNASAVLIECDDTMGEKSVRVAHDDFKRAVAALVGIDGQISFSLDPKGALCIRSGTDQGEFCVYVQTLREGDAKNDEVRERALLVRVENPGVEAGTDAE